MTGREALTKMGAVSRTWSAGICAAAFFVVGAFPLYSVDAYGHLAQGRQIAELGRVPRVDPFSFWKPEPQPWSNYEWGYDLGTWLLYDRFGPNALIALKCFLLALLGALLVLLGDRLSQDARGAAPLTAALAIFFAPFARIRFTVRPQVVGLVFAAVLLLGIGMLFSERTSRRARGWLVVGLFLLQAAWVNLHGSHLLGLLIGALFLAFSIRTPAFASMALLVGAQLVAMALNPFGLDIVTDAVDHLWRPEYRKVVTEWAPWSPEHPLYLLLAPVAAAVLVVVSMRPVTRSSRYGLAYGVLCVVLTVMAFRSLRFVDHQLLLTAPLIAAGLSQLRWIRALRRGTPIALGLSATWAVLASPRLEPFVPIGFGEPRLGHAFAAAEVINEHVQEPRILAPIQDSWPLLFAVPDGRFLIDGRVPFYGPEFIRKVTDSFSDPAALQAVLGRFDVNTVVVDHTRAAQAPAVQYLWRSAGWQLGQVQDRQSLFVRVGAAPSMIPLEIVGPGFETGRLLDPTVSDADIEREESMVGDHPSSKAIRGWIAGLRLLRPLARNGGRGGIRMAQTSAEQARARAAYRSLSEAAQVYPGFTSIELYRAMAAMAACDQPRAQEALGRALYTGQTRESTLVALELALRAGGEPERRAGEARLQRLLDDPQSARDPWVAWIAQDAQKRCP